MCESFISSVHSEFDLSQQCFSLLSFKMTGKARYQAIKLIQTFDSKHSSESCHFFSLVLALSFKTSKALLKLVNFSSINRFSFALAIGKAEL